MLCESEAMTAPSVTNEPWYHGSINREKAEAILLHRPPGTFLIRDSISIEGDFILSVSENNNINHYYISLRGGHYYIWDHQPCTSLHDVITHYKSHFLDNNTVLRDFVQRGNHTGKTSTGSDPPTSSEASAVPSHSHPLHKGVQVTGKFDFYSDDPEDLPFKKGDRMTLLSKEEDGWWLAGHSDGRKGLVPVPYITVVDSPDTSSTIPVQEPDDPTSDKNLYKNAMLNGYVNSGLGLLMLVGVTGSGKSEFKRLVLDEEVPEFSPSTPLAESAVRSMSVCQVAVDGIEWIIVGPQKMMDMIALTIKENCPILEETWGQSAILVLGESVAEPSPDATMDTNVAQVKTENEEKEVIKSKVETSASHSLFSGYSNALQKVNIDSKLLRMMRKSFTTEVKKLMDVDFVYLLDSGGQPPFREMLPHFVQQASAIVLMQKLNERLDFRPTIRYREEGEKVDQGYMSQLTNEQILHQYVQGVQSHKSKVFVVGTHRDMEDESQGEPRPEKNIKLLDAFRPVLGKQMELYKVGNPDQLIFPVNSKSRKEEDVEIAREFRKRVMEKCMGAKEKIPLPWFILEQLLQLLAQEMKVSVLSIDECCEAARQKLHMPRNVCEAALRYLGRLSIIYYRPDLLPGVVFCNAQVVLDKITELVRCSHALRTEEGESNEVPSCINSNDGLQFREYGLLDSELLGRAFPSHYRERLFIPPDFLHLLEGLLIAGRLDSGEHFIPSLLPDLPVGKLAEYRAKPNHPPPLLIHYPKMWLPVGVTASLVVHLQNECNWEPSEKHGTPTCMYHNCFQFKLPGGKPGSVTIIDSTKFLEVHLKCTLRKATTLCPMIRESILSGLKESHKSLHYNPPPETEMGFLCSGECDDEEPHLATLDDSKESWLCPQDDSVGDDLDEKQNLWLTSEEGPFDRAKLTSATQQTSLATDSLHDLRSTLQPVTDRWKNIGLALRLDLGQLKKIEKQCRDLDDCLTEMLSLWLNRNYNTKKHGLPSWELLAGAVRAAAGGNDSSLAAKIAKGGGDCV